MLPSGEGSVVLAVGDPVRPGVGRGVRGSLVLAGMFVAFAWSAKELPALYGRAPWQDDPYDALISATIFFVPVLAVLCLVRAPLCRRGEPLPVRRALDLLRASRVLVGTVLVTLAGEWVSVLLGAHRSAWTPLTFVLIGVLALLTAASLAAAAQLWRAWPGLSRGPAASAQPDWLADAATLAGRLAARPGRRHHHAATALAWLDRQVLTRVRRYPAWSAVLASLAFGAGLSASQALGEGYRPSTALLFLAVSASSMFGFLLAVGAHLRLTGPGTSGKDHVLHAAVAACASVSLTFAFRSALLSALGIPHHHALPVIAGLALLSAVLAGTTLLAVESGIRWHVRVAQRRNSSH